MKALETAFQLLTFFGFWKPLYWKSKTRRRLYNCICVILIPLPYLLAFLQILQILLQTNSINEITETLFLLLSTINVCFKGFNVLIRRQQVAGLLKMLTMKCVIPRNKKEILIYKACNNVIRDITRLGCALVVCTLIVAILLPIMKYRDSYALPVQIWLPYNYTESESLYWLTYAMNSVCIISMSNLSIGLDVIIYGFTLITGAQIDVLNNRILHLPENLKPNGIVFLDGPLRFRQEKYLISEAIQHHIFIYEFAEKFKDVFSISLFSQFIVSYTAISVSVYQLGIDLATKNPAFYSKVLYICTVMMQLYVFCWVGNELSIKSQQLGRSIFHGDWISLNTKSVKSIMLISLRSTKPIIISYGYYISFSLETFNKIIKVSYTVINVLKDSATKIQ